MHNMVTNISIQSYFAVPDYSQYYMMVPGLTTHTDDSHPSSRNEFSSNNFYIFPSKMKGFYCPVDYNNIVQDSSNNIP